MNAIKELFGALFGDLFARWSRFGEPLPVERVEAILVEDVIDAEYEVLDANQAA
jgi:hypothetical protein